MEKLCNNCKHWRSVDSMPNWGNCRKAGRRIRKVGDRLTGDVLRRYDENCCDFEPTQHPRRKHSQVSHTREAQHIILAAGGILTGKVMYMVENKENNAKGKNVSSELSSLSTEQALESFLKALQQGQSDEIVQLFIEYQARNPFPKGGDTLKQLTDNIGKKAATKTVVAFARLACFDCKEGLRPCEKCNGAGLKR